MVAIFPDHHHHHEADDHLGYADIRDNRLIKSLHAASDRAGPRGKTKTKKNIQHALTDVQVE